MITFSSKLFLHFRMRNVMKGVMGATKTLASVVAVQSRSCIKGFRRVGCPLWAEIRPPKRLTCQFNFGAINRAEFFNWRQKK